MKSLAPCCLFASHGRQENKGNGDMPGDQGVGPGKSAVTFKPRSEGPRGQREEYTTQEEQEVQNPEL